MANHRPPRRGGPQNRPPRPARGSRLGHGPRPRPAPEPGSTQEDVSGPERLQKVLAHAGVGSRRTCEELILQGRVTVDGQVVRELGTRVDPRAAQIAVDGQKVQVERPVYFAVNKPKGYVSTNDD